MGLVDATKIGSSLVTGHLQDKIWLYIPNSNVGDPRTFHLVYFHCYLLHED